MANRRVYQLSHCTYVCQYHLVWTPKYRGKILSDKYSKDQLKRIIKLICRCTIHAWHIGDEHIHLYLTIPPEYSVSYAVAVIKGKSSAWIKKQTKKFPKGTLWNRGYFISSVGINEMVVRKYVENQKHDQKELKTMKLPF